MSIFSPYIHGIQNSEIYFDAGNNAWRLQSLRNEGRHLILLDDPSLSTDIIPLGNHQWSASGASSTRMLTLSACFPSRFTCRDGACVDIG